MGYLNNLAAEIYNDASKKGWHDNPVAFGDAITNIHGELSEAWEEYRHGHKINKTHHSSCENFDQCELPIDCIDCELKKPEGVPSEFADVIIRVLDNCHMYGIDIDQAITEKMEYNRHRKYKHGGKII